MKVVTKLARCSGDASQATRSFKSLKAIMSPFGSLNVQTVYFDVGQRIKRHLFSDADLRYLTEVILAMQAKADQADRQLQEMTEERNIWKSDYQKQEKNFQIIASNVTSPKAVYQHSPKSYLQVLLEKNPPCLTHRLPGGPANGIRKLRR